jgi:hypothetical protein
MPKEFDKVYYSLSKTLEVSEPLLWEKAEEMNKQMSEMTEKGEINLLSEIKSSQPIDFKENSDGVQLALARAFIELSGFQEANKVLQILIASTKEGVQKQAKMLLEGFDNKKL